MRIQIPFYLLFFCLLASSCSSYHKVATWYKYRNDFHLPKPGLEKARPTSAETAEVATPSTVDAAPQTEAAPAVEAATSPAPAGRVSRKEARKARMASVSITPPQSTAPAPEAYASVSSRMPVPAPSVDAMARYREVPRPSDFAPKHTLHRLARHQVLIGTIGFVLALIGFIYGGFVLGTIGLIFGIIGLVKASNNPGEYRNGLSIAAIILGGLAFLAGVSYQRRY